MLSKTLMERIIVTAGLISGKTSALREVLTTGHVRQFMKQTLLALLIALPMMAQQVPVTNSDVLKMLANGVGPALIAQMISTYPCNFDLSQAQQFPVPLPAAMYTCMGSHTQTASAGAPASPAPAPKMTKKTAAADALSGTAYLTGSVIHSSENIQHGIAWVFQRWGKGRAKR